MDKEETWKPAKVNDNLGRLAQKLGVTARLVGLVFEAEEGYDQTWILSFPGTRSDLSKLIDATTIRIEQPSVEEFSELLRIYNDPHVLSEDEQAWIRLTEKLLAEAKESNTELDRSSDL